MADIKKCDICGAAYQGCEHSLISGVFSSAVTVSDYGDYSDGTKHTYNRYDTCPTCTTNIRNYIRHMMLNAASWDVSKMACMSDEAYEQPCNCRRCRKRRKEASQ